MITTYIDTSVAPPSLMSARNPLQENGINLHHQVISSFCMLLFLSCFFKKYRFRLSLMREDECDCGM